MTFCLRCHEDLFWCKCGKRCNPYAETSANLTRTKTVNADHVIANDSATQDKQGTLSSWLQEETCDIGGNEKFLGYGGGDTGERPTGAHIRRENPAVSNSSNTLSGGDERHIKPVHAASSPSHPFLFMVNPTT
jgi:hypothetical protein